MASPIYLRKENPLAPFLGGLMQGFNQYQQQQQQIAQKQAFGQDVQALSDWAAKGYKGNAPAMRSPQGTQLLSKQILNPLQSAQAEYYSNRNESQGSPFDDVIKGLKGAQQYGELTGDYGTANDLFARQYAQPWMQASGGPTVMPKVVPGDSGRVAQQLVQGADNYWKFNRISGEFEKTNIPTPRYGEREAEKPLTTSQESAAGQMRIEIEGDLKDVIGRWANPDEIKRAITSAMQLYPGQESLSKTFIDRYLTNKYRTKWTKYKKDNPDWAKTSSGPDTNTSVDDVANKFGF